MSPRMDAIITELVNVVRAQGKKTDEQAACSPREVDRVILAHPDYNLFKVSERRYIKRQVLYATNHYDVLTELLDDPGVTEIMVNGPDHIFIERAGTLDKSDIHFRNHGDAMATANKILKEVNRSVTFADPIKDARLPKTGYRVNVVRDPVALEGPIITIRKFSQKPMSMEQLLAYGSLTEDAADNLRKLVRAKYNVFVCGGTGSGKTTFLNALSNFIPATERIITIEDTAELQLASIENLVRLESWHGARESEPITIRNLIISALRMRPDRIIVGEVRGEEALDMLQAMNTGHEGSMSTGHANSCRGMLSRLESLVLSGEAGGKLPIQVIRAQIAAALDIMVHLGRLRDRSRRVLEIVEVLGMEDGEVLLNPLYRFRERGEENGRVIGTLERTENALQAKEKLLFAGESGAL